MKPILPLTFAALAPLAAAQTEVLYHVERPAGFSSAWGASTLALADLDGDGIGDLAVGSSAHGGGQAASIHSGADGAHLFDLVAPLLPMFIGQFLASVANPAGKGAPELVLIGTPSGAPGSPNGWIGVYSGLDGALLRTFAPPASIRFQRAAILVLGDVDGDGAEDFLCAVRADTNGDGWQNESAVQLFSSLTGLPIYADISEPAGLVVSTTFARVSDHDGDGLDDFALLVREGQVPSIEIRSSASGATLARLEPPYLDVMTNNNEPLIATEDADGDGLEDLAFGGVFSGVVAHVSSASGALLQKWDCADGTTPCLGSRLIEPGDLDGDGRADLIALETGAFGPGGVRLFGLDPAQGTILFDELLPELEGGYSSAVRLFPLPDVDPLGFPTFVLFEGLSDRASVRRYAPELGTPACASTVNASGQAATLRALGQASLAANRLALELEGANPHQYGVFVYGARTLQQPFGPGYRCIDGSALRLPALIADAEGALAQLIDLPSTALSLGGTWTFQGFFRDPNPFGFHSSDAVTVELLP